jgi:hypothetical protein
MPWRFPAGFSPPLEVRSVQTGCNGGAREALARAFRSARKRRGPEFKGKKAAEKLAPQCKTAPATRLDCLLVKFQSPLKRPV